MTRFHSIKDKTRPFFSNPLVRFYLIAVAVTGLQLLLFNHLADSIPNIRIRYCFLIPMAYLADAAIMLYPLFLLPRRGRWLINLPFWAITLFLLINIWYFRSYEDIMPLSSFFMTDNITPTLIHSTIGSVRWVDLLLMLPAPLLTAIYCINRRRLKDATLTVPMRIAPIAMALGIFAFVHIARSVLYYRWTGDRAHPISETWRFTKIRFSADDCLRAPILGDLGLPSYLILSLSKLSPDIALDEAQLAEIERFVSHDMPQYTDNPHAVTGSPNLILVIVESLNSWVIDYRLGGREVTPILNSLFRADSAITARRIVPQVADGMSSDGHLMYNTGLYPIFNGSTVSSYGDTPFPSIAKALASKGYSSMEQAGAEGRLWNNRATTLAYGFQRFYDSDSVKTRYAMPELGEDDAIFAYTLDHLTELPRPFYAQIVTITTHSPYGTPLPETSWVTRLGEGMPKEAVNYLEKMRRFDIALGGFIEGLKASGLYDNSVIVIISDHNMVDANVPEGREKATDADRMIPMVILNSGTTYAHNAVMGQVDVFPTLLDIMGLNSYRWKGTGRSILRSPEVNAAIAADGHIVGDSASTALNRDGRHLSDLIIRGRYFKR